MNEFLEHSTDNAIDQEPDVSIKYLQSSVDKLTKQKSVLEAANHEQSVSIMDLKYVPVKPTCSLSICLCAWLLLAIIEYHLILYVFS